MWRKPHVKPNDSSGLGDLASKKEQEARKKKAATGVVILMVFSTAEHISGSGTHDLKPLLRSVL